MSNAITNAVLAAADGPTQTWAEGRRGDIERVVAAAQPGPEEGAAAVEWPWPGHIVIKRRGQGYYGVLSISTYRGRAVPFAGVIADEPDRGKLDRWYLITGDLIIDGEGNTAEVYNSGDEGAPSFAAVKADLSRALALGWDHYGAGVGVALAAEPTLIGKLDALKAWYQCWLREYGRIQREIAQPMDASKTQRAAWTREYEEAKRHLFKLKDAITLEERKTSERLGAIRVEAEAAVEQPTTPADIPVRLPNGGLGDLAVLAESWDGDASLPQEAQDAGAWLIAAEKARRASVTLPRNLAAALAGNLISVSDAYAERAREWKADALKGYNLPDWRDIAGEAQASSAALRLLEAIQAAGVDANGLPAAIGDYKRAKADANEASRYCTTMDGIPIEPQKRAPGAP